MEVQLTAIDEVDGTFKPLRGVAGAIAMQIGSENLSVFNDLVSVKLTPMVQVDFTSGINSQQGTVTVNTTGSGDANASRLRLQTGTGSAALPEQWEYPYDFDDSRTTRKVCRASGFPRPTPAASRGT